MRPSKNPPDNSASCSARQFSDRSSAPIYVNGLALFFTVNVSFSCAADHLSKTSLPCAGVVVDSYPVEFTEEGEL